MEQDPEDKKIWPQPLPYISGLSERLVRIFSKHEAKVYHKPYNTLREQLVHPKDKTPTEKKCAVVYHLDCDQCKGGYTGETARSLETRMKEHFSTRRASLTAVGEHLKETGHEVSWDNIRVLARESNTSRRKIREAVEIMTNQPSLNRDVGFELPAIYQRLLRPRDPRSDRGASGSELSTH